MDLSGTNKVGQKKNEKEQIKWDMTGHKTTTLYSANATFSAHVTQHSGFYKAKVVSSCFAHPFCFKQKIMEISNTLTGRNWTPEMRWTCTWLGCGLHGKQSRVMWLNKLGYQSWKGVCRHRGNLLIIFISIDNNITLRVLVVISTINRPRWNSWYNSQKDFFILLVPLFMTDAVVTHPLGSSA